MLLGLNLQNLSLSDCLLKIGGEGGGGGGGLDLY